jgi:hypothetical protein
MKVMNHERIKRLLAFLSTFNSCFTFDITVKFQEIMIFLIAAVQKVVACWGKLKTDRGWLLRDTLGLRLDCLNKNKDGSPAHPLYLPYGLLPEPWNY